MEDYIKTFGEKLDHISYFDREGAYIVCIKNNSLAVVKTPVGYFLIGGGIENGENHMDCIKRECLEEIGCEIKNISYICSADTYCMHKRIGGFHPIQHYYSADIGEKITEPSETDHKFEWLALDKINLLFVESQIWAVEKYTEQNNP